MKRLGASRIPSFPAQELVGHLPGSHLGQGTERAVVRGVRRSPRGTFVTQWLGIVYSATNSRYYFWEI